MTSHVAPSLHQTPSTASQFGYRLTGPALRLAQVVWLASLVASVGIMASGLYAVLTYPADELFLSGYQLRELQVSQFYATFLVPLQVFIGLLALGLSGLIFWRQHDDGVAILISLTIMTVIVVLGLGISEANPWASPLKDAAIVFVTSIAQSAAFLLTLIFPNGRFVPSWTRWPALVWVGWAGLQIFVPQIYLYNLPVPVWSTLQVLVFGFGVWAQVYRYRRADSLTQRQQTRLIVYGIVQMLALQVVYQLLTSGRSNPADALVVFSIARLIYYISRLVLIVLLAVSALRYRLWGIEFIINRSLAYGSLSLGLVGLFAGALYLVSLVVPGQATLIAIAITAGLAGLVFQPARRFLQRFIDCNLYNIHIDYQSRPSPSPVSADLSPVHVAGYRDLALIGRGGMAEVYQATQDGSGQQVAIKLLYDKLVDSPEHLKRLTREARVMARLEHPNIARVLDYGQTEGEPARPYLIIEYLPGEDLGRRLKARGRLSLEESLGTLDQLTSALEYAHGQGIVHRDIKPSNVMLVPGETGERAVVMDFGIAKLIGSQTMMTHTGDMVGTFDYIAPEQIRSPADVDARADLYALGILAYRMLTGELPFRHLHPGGLLIAHLNQPPPDPRQLAPELPIPVVRALLKALSKKPEERFSGVREFFAALQPDVP